ncbi:7157_t:CDS:1, partial [Acaulospora colombiana]
MARRTNNWLTPARTASTNPCTNLYPTLTPISTSSNRPDGQFEE